MKIDIEAVKIKAAKNKANGFEFQRRRHDQWKENYELYRDTVIINRFTQRQSVNIPLAKETVRTILAGISDPPDTQFEELDNDKDKEIFINEYYNWFLEDTKMRLKDIVDKKQVLWFGRSWKKLLVADGKPYAEIEDIQDMLVDRQVDPTDVDTAGHLTHRHIFRSLEELTENENYDQEAVTRLKVKFATDQGLFKASENQESLSRRNDRMREMGVPDIDNPEVSRLIVEVNEHYMKLWDEKKKKNRIVLATVADGEVLMAKPLTEILGDAGDHYWDSHFPFTTWADDVERVDFYSDGWMDVVRTPNKILNAWFSQLVENRTLRNYGMNMYDSTMDGFVPQTFEPVPFGWYPFPVPQGKTLKDVFQKVDIPDLSESLDEMNFLISMVESATAATKTEKGQSEKGDATLGEVKMIAAKAQARITSISTFYQQDRQDFAYKWYKMIESNADHLEAVTIYKKSYKGNIFKKTISPADWKSKTGYRVKVVSTAEKDQKNVETIQRLAATNAYFQNNAPFQRIFKKKLLNLNDLNPEEMREVMDFEEQSLAAASAAPAMPGMPASAPQQLTPQPSAIPMA